MKALKTFSQSWAWYSLAFTLWTKPSFGQSPAVDSYSTIACCDSCDYCEGPKQEVLVPGCDHANMPTPTVQDSHSGFRTVAYFVNWAVYARKHFPWDIPADQLTHVLYAFANVKPDSGEVHLSDTWSDIEQHFVNRGDSWNDAGTNLYGNFKQFFLLKKQNRNLKLLLSIGGWTYSSNFAQPASTPAGRAHFAKTAVQLLKDHGLDGLDIDWEYPKNPQEGQDYLALLKAVRNELDAYASTLPERPHFLLTIAAPAGANNYRNMPLGHMAQVLDFINLMAYDYSGSWDQRAGHLANLYQCKHDSNQTPFSTESAINDYVAAGVPSDKIVLGMPLYGRAFLDTKGPGHHFQGIGEGSFETGVWDYKALPRQGATEYYDAKLGAAWCYDPNSKMLVSYDNAASTRQKVDYIKGRSLGGAMWWESSGDKAGAESLIGAVCFLDGPISLQDSWVC
jgi:chitinase